MKKLIILFSIIIVLIIIGFVVVKNVGSESTQISNNITTNNTNKNSEIVIIKYKLGTSDELKRVYIKSEKEIHELNEFMKELKPLSDDEITNTAYMQEILIKYNDSETIATQLNSGICLYKNTEKNIQYMSKMSTEFIKWIEAKMK